MDVIILMDIGYEAMATMTRIMTFYSHELPEIKPNTSNNTNNNVIIHYTNNIFKVI